MDKPVVGWVCCFCGKGIAGPAVEILIDGTQDLYAHKECTRKVIHPIVPFYWE